MRNSFFVAAALVLVLLFAFGCSKSEETKAPAEKKQTAEETNRNDAQTAANKLPEPKAFDPGNLTVPTDLVPIKCSGALKPEDIPDKPLVGVINGKYLKPNMGIAKASKFMKQVSFDFGNMKNIKDDTPCFATGTRVKASVYYKLDQVKDDKDLAVPLGTHSFTNKKGEYTFIPIGKTEPEALKGADKNKKKWRGWFIFEQDSGTPMSVNPPYYGVVVLDELNVGAKPEKPFTPSGTAKGRMAVCFGDKENSWMAGTFEIPVCR